MFPLTQNDRLVQFTGYIYLAITGGSEAAVDALTARLRADGYPVLDGPRPAANDFSASAVLESNANRIGLTG